MNGRTAEVVSEFSLPKQLPGESSPCWPASAAYGKPFPSLLGREGAAISKAEPTTAEMRKERPGAGRTWIVTIDEPIFFGRMYQRLIEADTEEISGVVVLPAPSGASLGARFDEALYRLRFWGLRGSIFAGWQLARARALGRGNVIAAARKVGIPAFREDSLTSAIDRVRRAHAGTVLASVSSRVPQEGLEAAQIGWVNTHCGPLPRYAGLDAPFWCLYHGEPEVSVTLHYMSKNFDDGPILAQRSLPAGTRTYFSLLFELFELAYSMHLGFLKDSWPDPSLLPKQGSNSKTYFSKPPIEAGKDFRRRGGRFA